MGVHGAMAVRYVYIRQCAIVYTHFPHSLLLLLLPNVKPSQPSGLCCDVMHKALFVRLSVVTTKALTLF